MHLRAIKLRGFKSFPERVGLEFSPGVSVIVGPNGSGKSNITDAVLWALGYAVGRWKPRWRTLVHGATVGALVALAAVQVAGSWARPVAVAVALLAGLAAWVGRRSLGTPSSAQATRA